MAQRPPKVQSLGRPASGIGAAGARGRRAVRMTPTALALITAAALAADQATKALALAQLVPGHPVALAPGLNLTLGFNEGASFGMLAGAMAGRPEAMALLTGILTLVLAVVALRAQRPPEAAGFALIVGGSLGNILDRLRRGTVTDFFDIFWRDWHWPTFNFADIAIVCGAGLVLAGQAPRRGQETLDG